MNTVFFKYKELFEIRYSMSKVATLGEDSIRYDFFTALSDIKKLQPWQIHLEYPIDSNCYVPRNTEGSKRGESPQVDLWVNEMDLKLCIEFGFFRRNSNENGDISVTENLFKMLNDFVRIALHADNHLADSYFVCVADETMIDTKLVRIKSFDKFPANTYSFKWNELNNIKNLYKSAKKIDDRFLQKMEENNYGVHAQLIFKEQIISEVNHFKTFMLVWKICLNKH